MSAHLVLMETILKGDLKAFEAALPDAAHMVNEVCRTEGDNASDAFGYTLLGLACAREKTEFVRRLLRVPSIDVNLEGLTYSPPLHLSAYSGHVEIAQLLLGALGIDVNQVDGKRTRETLEAERLDYNEVLGWFQPDHPRESRWYFTEHNADERADYCTALFYACARRALEIVKALLARPEIDVNLGSANKTPLHEAASQGDTAIVAALLSHPDVDVNLESGRGRTPLAYALANSSNGDEVARLIIGAKNFDFQQVVTTNWSGSSALSEAARWADWRFINFLISNVANCDASGKPLCSAVKAGRPDIVRLLLSSAHTDVNRSDDSEGFAPLHFAVRQDEKALELMDILLTDPRIDVNRRHAGGRSALFSAVRQGELPVVQRLLARTKIDLDEATVLDGMIGSQDQAMFDLLAASLGGPPRAPEQLTMLLCEALHYENYFLATLVLAAPELDLNADYKGRPPLVWAVSSDCLVRDLASDPRVDPNRKGKDGRTAISQAVEGDKWSSLLFLLFNRDQPRANVNVNLRHSNGRTALHMAATRDDVRRLRLLLTFPGVEVNARNDKGETPLHSAYRRPQNVRELLKHADVDVNARNCEGATVLHMWAGRSTGADEALPALLSAPYRDVNAVDEGGQTPLHHAVKSFRTENVKLLLEQPDIACDIDDNEGRTPFALLDEPASDSKAQEEIRRLLLARAAH